MHTLELPMLGDIVSESSPLVAARTQIFVAVDLETTGLDLQKHGIIQIGAYATGTDQNDLYGTFLEDATPFAEDDGTTRANLDSLFMHFEDSAFQVNGFTIERIFMADALVNVLCRFKVWLDALSAEGDVTLVFHNAAFDVPRLELAMSYFKVPQAKQLRRVLDTVSLGFMAMGKAPSLKDLAAHYGIVNRTAHKSALTDAITTSKVFHAIQEDFSGRTPS